MIDIFICILSFTYTFFLCFNSSIFAFFLPLPLPLPFHSMVVLTKMRGNRCPTRIHLGPLLFLIYVNHLPNSLEVTIPGVYTDDIPITAVAETVSEFENRLNRDMENIGIWFTANRLSANASKTKFIIIASNYRWKKLVYGPMITLKSEVIQRVTKAKLLGVLLDEKLSWENHINDVIIPQVLKALRMIRSMRTMLSIPDMVALYETLVLPHLEYCCTLWGNCMRYWRRRFKSYKIGQLELLPSPGMRLDLQKYYLLLVGLTLRRKGNGKSLHL